MIGLLETAAARSPTHTAVVTSEGSACYGELLDGARGVAAGLLERGITRFAIVEHDAVWVLRLLAGAALAGAEACQYQADIPAGELAEQARATGHAVVVSRRAELGDALAIVPPDELWRAQRGDIAPAPGAQPVLIRTTGTTGLPKSARHDWGVLARTVANVEPRPEQRWLLAYGPHQFAGIQVLQHVVAAHATLVAPFPRQPKDGLAALLEHDVTCVSATPTYWRFLLAEARSRAAELPALEQITLGGEATRGDLLDELRSAFPAARISHVYASTEFGSVASVRDGKPGFPVAALFSEANPTSNLKVVDGQLWVRAAAGMLGYVGDAGEGATRPEPGEWRPTGDLVEVDGDRVAFRGRTSEVINVGGMKVHPLPVEDRITALGRVALARVFGHPNPLTGAIVAVEVVPASGVEEADHEDLRNEIRAAVADLPRAWHPRRVTFVGSIATRGQKTLRGMQA
jgi:acyl-CoA synthetase (AMP-forming)/AMP-acid ligase II